MGKEILSFDNIEIEKINLTAIRLLFFYSYKYLTRFILVKKL